MTWRESCRPIIARVLQEHHGKETLKRALFDAYPWGERKYHPYQIWLDEIARQTGRKREISRRTFSGREYHTFAKQEADERQGDLFGEAAAL